ncbi:unnamed protein product [Camellia sinensis]
MVYLLGGHTVGVAHCSLFEDRLYNFQNSGKPDPIMNLVLLEILKSRCPQNATVDNTADLDENPNMVGKGHGMNSNSSVQPLIPFLLYLPLVYICKEQEGQ